MKLYDLDIDKEYTLKDLYNDYKVFSVTDPDNHYNTFTGELYNILMATINGRNNLDIVGLTGKETSNYIIKLREKVLNNV